VLVVEQRRCPVQARRDEAKIDVPVMVLVAADDRMDDPEGSLEFAAALPVGRATLHWYAPLWHEVFNEREPERARVLKDLQAWIAGRLEAKRA
jgi:alpha-beta hydrolase superfamily lysophospholipase